MKKREADIIFDKYKDHQFCRIMPPGAIKASVLMPLTQTADGLSLLFEVRSGKIAQGGEICFPGGRIEKDEYAEETAVRETAEELLVDQSDIRIIAPMFKMIGPAGADIFAYLGVIDNYRDTFSEDEVESVFKLPLGELLKAEPLINDALFVQTPQGEDFHYELIPNGRDYRWAHIRKKYYFYKTEYGVIWGMTGELLYNLLELFRRDGIGGLIH